MRHLRVLEEAGLVTSRKGGRTRRDFLNAVPIQTVYDRWVDPFTKPFARGLARIKHDLQEPMTDAGSAYAHQEPDGPLLGGEIVESVPHERLVMTFRPLFNLEAGADPEGAQNVARKREARSSPAERSARS